MFPIVPPRGVCRQHAILFRGNRDGHGYHNISIHTHHMVPSLPLMDTFATGAETDGGTSMSKYDRRWESTPGALW